MTVLSNKTSFSNSIEASMTEYPPDPKDIYADLREKWKHEDNLVNHRVTWLLNTQAFSLTAYGVLAKLRLDTAWSSNGGWDSAPFSAAELAVPIVALFILHFLSKGIQAAIRAMGILKDELRKHQDCQRVWTKITVDVLDDTTQEGAKAPMRMVMVFQCVWCVLLVFEFASIFSR
jgi:hypothetical protein